MSLLKRFKASFYTVVPNLAVDFFNRQKGYLAAFKSAKRSDLQSGFLKNRTLDYENAVCCFLNYSGAFNWYVVFQLIWGVSEKRIIIRFGDRGIHPLKKYIKQNFYLPKMD
ncbi:MAG: hypothetical protein CR988_04930 [Treponema sp.]|nr:MAG: hypothetical protein CR988_04930 [Treponema sp.]